MQTAAAISAAIIDMRRIHTEPWNNSKTANTRESDAVIISAIIAGILKLHIMAANVADKTITICIKKKWSM